MKRHIFLIGMPGSGKSSLGRRTANRMGIPYVDTDHIITQVVGKSIQEIFQTLGEQAFRNAETNILFDLVGKEPAIVSTGGGMILRDINQKIMQNHGVVLLVDRPIDQILSDIKLDRRPMLAEKGIEEVPRLYEERIPVYKALADDVLDNSKGYYPGLSNLERLIKEWA